ncbi:MAG TPA: choice-of-anchor L domain-containing protein [Brumimicrobium sp.]|nr:choice-of-anchor L domain-containing protein [Brumimicrobium sp.]
MKFNYTMQNKHTFLKLNKSFSVGKLILALTFMFFQATAFSQITFPTPFVTPQQAVENVLLGPGVQASGFKYNGNGVMAVNVQSNIRRFVNTNAVFPLDEGVLMHTANAPNVSGDPDLNAINLSNSNISNGVILEFDFVPEGDTLSFSYIFSSAEYSSFTCSSFNDVFGFFISGPGISGPYSNNSINIATIPGTNTPVGINTVNSGNVTSSNCFNANPNYQQDSQYWTSSFNSVYNSSPAISGSVGSPNFNGSTIELTANASVICGETYHIKLAISNVSDQSYNSGVFLKAGSFSSVPTFEISGQNTTTMTMDSVLVEGCDMGNFCFTRPIEIAEDTAVVHFEIGGTAILGVDYNFTNIPNTLDSIILYPGETDFCIDIEPVLDGLLEGLESIEISTFSVNPCGDTLWSEARLYIADKPDIPIPNAGSNFAVCDGGTGVLEGEAEVATNTTTWTYDGPGVITFTPNANDPNATVSFTEPGSYTLFLTEANDTCDVFGIDSVTVVYGEVLLDVSNDTIICQNGQVDLIATGNTTSNSPLEYHWDHTTDVGAVQNVTPLENTTYSVFAENTDGCISQTKTITVSVHPPLELTITPTLQSICPGDMAQISSVVTGGNGGPYTLVWTDPTGNVVGDEAQIAVSPESTSIYTLTVSDNCETTPVTLTSEVVVEPLPEVMFSVTEPALCTPAVFEVINNTDPNMVDQTYWYVNSGHSYANLDTINPDITSPGVYDVKLVVVSPAGCVDSLSVNNFLEVYALPEVRFTYTPNPTTVLNTEVKFQNGTTGAVSYQWTFEDGLPAYSSLTNPTVNFPEGIVDVYDVEMIAYTEFGCTDTVLKRIRVQPEVLIFAPNSFTPDNDSYNEVWKVHLLGVDVYNVTIEVFNRWGEQVWESHDIEYGWDGTYGGKPVPTGSYIWKVSAADRLTDGKYEWQGQVTILR